MDETRGMAADRTVLRVGGEGARAFLQGLVTNDVDRLDVGPVYAALLTPQGKYLFDFIMLPDGADVLIDVANDRAAALAQRLTMYRLRAPVTIGVEDMAVTTGLGPMPSGERVFADPRDASLGWRAYGAVEAVKPLAANALTAQRVALGVPESGAELIPDDSYILEMDFERLHGVDFRKGCYVGQEVTARMKHKTALKKGLKQVVVDGPPPPAGAEILVADRSAGTLHTVAAGLGLAYLRFDRIAGEMRAGDALIRLREEAV